MKQKKFVVQEYYDYDSNNKREGRREKIAHNDRKVGISQKCPSPKVGNRFIDSKVFNAGI